LTKTPQLLIYLEGPDAVEIDVPKFQPILDSYGLSITGHTDPCLPYAYPIQGVRTACLNKLKRCAGIFAELGADVMNIHPIYFCPSAMRNSIVDIDIEALNPIQTCPFFGQPRPGRQSHTVGGRQHKLEKCGNIIKSHRL